MATFDKGTVCSAWNYSANRLATGSADGTLVIFDSPDPSSSSTSLTRTSNFKVFLFSFISLFLFQLNFIVLGRLNCFLEIILLIKMVTSLHFVCGQHRKLLEIPQSCC